MVDKALSWSRQALMNSSWVIFPSVKKKIIREIKYTTISRNLALKLHPHIYLYLHPFL